MSRNLILDCVVVAMLFSCTTPTPLNFEVGAEMPERGYAVLNEMDNTKHGDCKSLLKAGYNVSGVYRLYLENREIYIPCEFRDDNAFTVILRRMDQSQSFTMPWASYENGFGHPQGNYWAGLATIYALAYHGQNQLQVDMQDWIGTSRSAHYSHFYLEPRNTRYRLHVGGFSGTVPDELSYHNNMPFSTYDAPDPKGCASQMKAGWWYNYCAYTLLTGTYYYGGPYTPHGSMYDGIFWINWHPYNYSLKFVSLTVHN